MKLVITMSRRFGTGASVIANELSKRLDIPVYDKAYVIILTWWIWIRLYEIRRT